MMKTKMFIGSGLLALVIIAGIFASIGGGTPSSDITIDSNISASVEFYRATVEKYCEQEDLKDMKEYVSLILAVMQQESNGQGNDPMQASEGPFNKSYPQTPNGISDPNYSIECGIRELQDCLHRAKVKSIADMEKIKVALAGYNFGNGYIEWVQIHHKGIWTYNNAQEFSKIQAERLGWDSYGDTLYPERVMNYYIVDNAGETSPLGSEKYKIMMEEAEKYIDMTYVFGGADPNTGFDCSGYICWVYTHSGVYDLPRTTAQGIYNQCVKIKREDAKPGDFIFFENTYDCPDNVSHIGIYIGNNIMLHCGTPSIRKESIDSIYWTSHFYGFGRLKGV